MTSDLLYVIFATVMFLYVALGLKVQILIIKIPEVSDFNQNRFQISVIQRLLYVMKFALFIVFAVCVISFSSAAPAAEEVAVPPAVADAKGKKLN